MDYIGIPPESGNVVYTINELKTENAQWLCERAILAPRNDCVAHVNNQLLNDRDFLGNIVIYKSIDTFVES